MADYSKMVADEIDPAKKARLKAQLDKAGLKYTETSEPTKTQETTRQDILKSNGTDYDTYMKTQEEAQNIASTYKKPVDSGYDSSYESYVSENVGLGNAVMSKPQWESYKQQSRINYKPKNKDEEDYQTSKVGSNYAIGGTTGNVSSLLEQQKQASLNTAQSGLNATRENVLANLAAKKAEIDPRIAQSRASAVSGTTIAQKRLADLIPFSGTMAGTQVKQGEALNTDLQNRQSALDVEREQSFKDIATQETEAERSYQQGLAQAQAQAQEQYLQEQLANARTQEERDYASKQLADQRAYNQQQTDDERAYQEEQTKAQTEREDYLTTIGQFSQNYQKEINNLLAQGVPENDYRVQYLRTARTQKLANMAEAEQNAYVQNMQNELDQQEQALELAKWRFNNGLPATQMDAELLGVQVGQVSPSQTIKNAELAIQKQKANKTSSGGSSSGSSNGQITTPTVKTNTLKSQIDKNVTSEIENRGLNSSTSTLAQLRADQIVKYAENNQLTDQQAAELIATYGLTQAEIEQAERRLNLVRGLGGQ